MMPASEARPGPEARHAPTLSHSGPNPLDTLLALCAFLWTAFRSWGYQVDDSITLRFARNLVEGHGLVFNPGERVEGYTSRCRALPPARVDPLSVLTAVSTVAPAGTVWLTARFERRVVGAESADERLEEPPTEWVRSSSCEIRRHADA